MAKVVKDTKDFIEVETKYRDEGTWASFEVYYDNIAVFSYDELSICLCRLEDDEIKTLSDKGISIEDRYLKIDKIDEDLK